MRRERLCQVCLQRCCRGGAARCGHGSTSLLWFVDDRHELVHVGEGLGTPAMLKATSLFIIFITEREREESNNFRSE